ncbi:hypothetical protein [Mangrovimonas futianensis]|nr:hypothetical protein [Mangrovimonas futianensis]MCF1420311.1 hypothetical protein [Mangrovimonas futianensis]
MVGFARSDPQARIILSSGCTPIKNDMRDSAYLIGVWGARVATGEEGM